MIDDGCDLNRWLWAGQMTSSYRRSNEERAQDYRSITLCLWKPYSDHKTNSTVAIAEYKSHTLCSSMRVSNMCSKKATPVFFFSEKKRKDMSEGLMIYLLLSHIQPYGRCVCLLTGVYLAARCQSGASIGVVLHPEGKPYELKGQTRLHQRLLVNIHTSSHTLTLCVDALSPSGDESNLVQERASL